MTSVIVSGGAGFIGSATCELLVSHGYKVIIIDNLYSGSVGNVKHLINSGKAHLITADISSKERVMMEVKRFMMRYGDEIAGIIHLAAIVNVDEVREKPDKALMVNVVGTLNILELARLIDVRRIVYASSVAVYGEPKYLPIDELHPTKPKNLYGLTKLMGEEVVQQYAIDYDLKPVILRYFNVYGPRMRAGPYAGVVYNFITKLLRGETPVIYGDGKQTRDFVYVYDVARANIKALKSNYVGVVNVGTGTETSINKLYKTICKIVNYCPQPTYLPPRKGDIRRSKANILKARSILKWVPKTSLEVGLKETINFYKHLS